MGLEPTTFCMATEATDGTRVVERNCRNLREVSSGQVGSANLTRDLNSRSDGQSSGGAVRTGLDQRECGAIRTREGFPPRPNRLGREDAKASECPVIDAAAPDYVRLAQLRRSRRPRQVWRGGASYKNAQLERSEVCRCSVRREHDLDRHGATCKPDASVDELREHLREAAATAAPNGGAAEAAPP
jgi:hypothetical protein